MAADPLISMTRHNQGFCCKCGFNDQVFGDGQYWRGGLNCAFMGGGQASAHCMRV
jgi:hypothetical protein